MSAPLTPPGQRWKYLAYAFAISGGIVALMMCLNREYLFHTEIYETGDQGANSLSVLRSKDFHEIYGAYSRWELHHPGPAEFYAFGWAEELFYSAFRWMPTPYNAQVLASMMLCAGFFAGAVCAAARWVQSRFFLPLTLLLGALHYVSVDPHLCLMSTWAPHMMPMIFLALVVAAASVGAGQGDDLPLLVLAAGFSVHSNLAQPLFVLPLFSLGYLGLAAACRRSAKAASPGPTGLSALPWRRFPRAHAFAAVVLFAFVLPLLADVCRGTNSNLWRIVHHLPKNDAQHHPWLACVFYLLRFGAYHPSLFGAEYSFSGHAAPADLRRFCLTHAGMMGLWIGAALTPFLALAARRYWPQAESHPADGIAEGGSGHPAVADDTMLKLRRRRFVAWLSVCGIAAMGLTLYWAHLIELEMSYYHVWFSYSIWFALAMVAAASLSDLLETCAVHVPRQRWALTAVVVLVGLFGTAWTINRHQARFRETLFADPFSVAQAATIKAALAEQSGGAKTKLIAFPILGAETATGMTAILARWGYHVRVDERWLNEWGRNYAPPDLLEGLPWSADGSATFDVWRIVPAGADPEAAAKRPLVHGYALVLTHPEIDPVAGADITFDGPRPNYDAYVVTGWTPRMTDVPFVWSEGHTGLICFHPKPIPPEASVEVAFDCLPMLLIGTWDQQRVRVGINQHDLGTFVLDNPGFHSPSRVLIPAAVWNNLPLGMLTLRFLDPVAPQYLYKNNDPRLLAVGTRKITFRLANPSAQ